MSSRRLDISSLLRSENERDGGLQSSPVPNTKLTFPPVDRGSLPRASTMTGEQLSASYQSPSRYPTESIHLPSDVAGPSWSVSSRAQSMDGPPVSNTRADYYSDVPPHPEQRSPSSQARSFSVYSILNRDQDQLDLEGPSSRANSHNDRSYAQERPLFLPPTRRLSGPAMDASSPAYDAYLPPNLTYDPNPLPAHPQEVRSRTTSHSPVAPAPPSTRTPITLSTSETRQSSLFTNAPDPFAHLFTYSASRAATGLSHPLVPIPRSQLSGPGQPPPSAPPLPPPLPPTASSSSRATHSSLPQLSTFNVSSPSTSYSTITPKSSTSPYQGLEALVQAATEEMEREQQRRLSFGTPVNAGLGGVDGTVSGSISRASARESVSPVYTSNYSPTGDRPVSPPTPALSTLGGVPQHPDDGGRRAKSKSKSRSAATKKVDRKKTSQSTSLREPSGAQPYFSPASQSPSQSFPPPPPPPTSGLGAPPAASPGIVHADDASWLEHASWSMSGRRRTKTKRYEESVLEVDQRAKTKKHEEPVVDNEVDNELLSLVGHPFVGDKLTKGYTKAHAATPDFDFGQPFASGSSPVVGSPADRESMPPPQSNERPGSALASNASKKKGPAKPKAPPKPRTRPPPKPKGKAITVDGAAASPATLAVPSTSRSKKGGTAAARVSDALTAGASRSRSASTMPGASARESLAPEAADGGKGQEEEEDKQDDRLWCICKTKWDNDSVMIGCDSCEDWYHPRCVNMPEHLMDLVDQYFCPNCVSNDRSKRTTWKRRCLYGLSQPNPSSAKACHRPTRAENSKFCSDECGVKHMKARIDSWADKGGNKDLLWDSVKTAPKRQGVVMLAPSTDEARPPLVATIGVTKKDEKGGLPPRERYDPAPAPTIIKPEKTPVAREIERLNARIEGLVEKREALRKEMDLIVWREKLLELASSRSEHVDECAWDQRLCFGDEECVEYGAGVLESYEEPAAGGARDNGADAMQAEEDGQWWCRGKKKCDRHAGWQKLRAQDIEKEKDLKNSLLANLAKMERAIRKRIEDLAAPQVHRTVPEPASPVGDVENKPSAARAHGHSKPKTNGQASKRGKKRKAD